MDACMQEYESGHIKGALNVSSGVFKAEDTAELDRVIRAQLASAQEVVVHCQMSMVRTRRQCLIDN